VNAHSAHKNSTFFNEFAARKETFMPILFYIAILSCALAMAEGLGSAWTLQKTNDSES
jgi:hypothetical protein